MGLCLLFHYCYCVNSRLPTNNFIPHTSQINSLNSTTFQNRKTRWLTMSALLIFGKEWNFLYPIQCRHGKHEEETKLGSIDISEFRLYKSRLVCILFYIFTFCSLTSCIPLLYHFLSVTRCAQKIERFFFPSLSQSV